MFIGRVLLLIVCIIATLAVACPNPTSIFNSKSRPYEAPLIYFDPRSPISPNSYIVYFRKGHTRVDHEAAIGTSIAPYVRFTFDDLYPDKFVYSCDNVGDELLAAIRADRGVEMVEYNLEWL